MISNGKNSSKTCRYITLEGVVLYVRFGEANNMFIVGNVLVGISQYLTGFLKMHME